MKKVNDYLKQIRIEIKNMFSSKLMIVMLCLLLIGSIAIPLLGLVEFGNNRNYNRYAEDLEVNGVTISNESPLYWETREALDRKKEVESNATNKNADLQIEYLDTTINTYVDAVAKSIDHEDYRMRLVYKKIELQGTLFALDHMDLTAEEMDSITNGRYRRYDEGTRDVSTSIHDLSEIERMKKREETENKLTTIIDIIDNDNHEAYFKYTIANLNNEIVEYEHQIEELEKDIIEKPENEKMYSESIKNIKASIEGIKEVRLPISEYRLEHNIIPGSDMWQDKALSHKESALSGLKYTEVVSQEKFNTDDGLKQQYKTYAAYKKTIEKRINEMSEQLLVANNSLETQEPDMLYVKDSARNKVTNFLYYSLLFAVIAAIISGKSMAKEFQSGTIRLLLIRPKTRTKIALSKLFAIIIVLLSAYGLSIILNVLTNGFLFGFADLSYPNYTISNGIKGISFFSFIIPKILACTVTILFASSVAYFLSIVTRNTALSVAIPLICFAGSMIFMDIIRYSEKFKWVIYTPAPYVNLPLLLTEQIYSPTGIEPNVVYGVSLLIVLSVIITAMGTYLFNKKDIVN